MGVKKKLKNALDNKTHTMNKLKILKIGTEFILEATAFTYSKNIEKAAPSIQWTLTPEGGNAEAIGIGKAINYKISDKYEGKKITFRAFIKEDSKTNYPLQSLTCFVEEKVSVAGIYIEEVLEVTNKTNAKVGDTVEYKVTQYNVASNKITEAQKKCIKWDYKVEGGKKEHLVDEHNNPFQGETIRFNVPHAWVEKSVLLMPYMNQSTEKISVKTNISPSEEYIVVVGKQSHSSDWKRNLAASFIDSVVAPNSKLMFIHQAFRRMRLNSNISFTFLLCHSPNGANALEYTDKQINAIQDTVENTYNGTFVKVSSAKQIINYINTGDVNNFERITSKRKNKPIKQLLFYSHGVVGEISLALGPTGFDLTEFSFKEAEVKKINQDAFDAKAHIYSYACRTGLGNSKIDKSIYINEKKDKDDPNNKYNLLSSQSLAQKIANISNSVVYAYLKRTWYGDTLFTNDEYDFMDAYDAFRNQRQPKRSEVKSGKKYNNIVKKGPNDDEENRYQELKKIRTDIKYIDNANFLASGALHPVRAADTPTGLPDDMKTYQRL